MKYALIGCGRIAVNHIIACQNNHFDLVAVCDVDENKCVSLLSKYDLNEKVKVYTDYKDMISKNNIDLISIATSSGMHAEIALYCISNGINVIIEKPMAMNMYDADKIVEYSKKYNVKVSVCHQNRFNIAVQNMRKALEEGRFGVLSHGSVNVRWNRNKEYYEQASWRGTWDKDGGTLMNQCIHGIDLLKWMCGSKVVEVYGQTRNRLHEYIEAEDIGTAILKFENGIIATIEGSVNVYPSNLEETLYLFGEKGTVKLGGKSTNKIEVWNFSDEQESDSENRKLDELTSNVYGNGHTSLFADVVSAVNEDREPYINVKAGRDAVEIVLAIYKSQLTGLPVKLPLTDFGTVDMKGVEL